MTRPVRITSSSFNAAAMDTNLNASLGDGNGVSWDVPNGGSLYISRLRYFDKVVSMGSMDHVATNPLAPTVFSDASAVGDVEVSVKDFGAVGDGITDDTYSVQSAIDFVSQRGGGVVLFPVGGFFVTGILVGSDITLRGASRSSSTIFGNWNDDKCPILVNGSNVSFERLRMVML